MRLMVEITDTDPRSVDVLIQMLAKPPGSKSVWLTNFDDTIAIPVTGIKVVPDE